MVFVRRHTAADSTRGDVRWTIRGRRALCCSLPTRRNAQIQVLAAAAPSKQASRAPSADIPPART